MRNELHVAGIEAEFSQQNVEPLEFEDFDAAFVDGDVEVCVSGITGAILQHACALIVHDHSLVVRVHDDAVLWKFKQVCWNVRNYYCRYNV